jgi:hypothetical protein
MTIMIKLFSVFYLTLIAVGTLHIQEQNNWTKEIHNLKTQVNQYRQQKDWENALKTMDKMKELYYKLQKKQRHKYFKTIEISTDFYYDYTQYSLFAGKTSSALQAFEKFTQYVVNKKVEFNISQINSDTCFTSIRKNEKFIECMEKIKQHCDYLQILKDASSYCNDTTQVAMRFRYMEPGDSNLVFLREHYKLDSIAGYGDELSKIKNLLHWIHEVVRHDGSSYNPKIKNTHAIIELCKKENRGVNCRMMAQMLTEVYLAMGFKARFVTCLPRYLIGDCHVITTVYSRTLNKWIWVDPTYDAYITDENGTMLSISEVRSRLRNDQELYLNDYANWNHQSKQTKEYYLYYYMAKNLYYLECMEESRYNAETEEKGRIYKYYTLGPCIDLDKKTSSTNYVFIHSANEKLFWQSPYENQ